MKIISFNCNSVNARHDLVVKMVDEREPEVLMLQETRCSYEDLEELAKKLGMKFAASIHDKPGYAGVAIFWNDLAIALNPTRSTSELMKGRVLLVDAVDVFSNESYLIANCYIHQGKYVDHEDYQDKLTLMSELSDLISNETRRYSSVVVGGDFNICPEDVHVWSTAHWHDGVISRTVPEKDKFNHLLTDCDLINIEPKSGELMTWYGYRHAWRKLDDSGNRVDTSSKYGVKCDHFLTDRINGYELTILDQYRFGVNSPSDHIPMELECC